MRKLLKKLGTEKRHKYKATVGRMGIKSNDFKGFPERTILLLNLIETSSNKIITDHLWFTVHKTLKKLNLKEGDKISFDARVGTYKKGYGRNKKIDYKLNYMTKIDVVRQVRELAENEITSATEPTFEELFQAQAKHANHNIQEVIYE